MRLTGTVVALEAAGRFTQQGERCTIKIEQADGMFNEFRMPNTAGYKLNDRLELDVRIASSTEPLRGVTAAADAVDKVTGNG